MLEYDMIFILFLIKKVTNCRFCLFMTNVYLTDHLYFQNQSGVKEFSTFHSFDNPKGRAIQKAPVGTKSMLAALFIKHKSAKMKKIAVR
jgi:hypothetical protein